VETNPVLNIQFVWRLLMAGTLLFLAITIVACQSLESVHPSNSYTSTVNQALTETDKATLAAGFYVATNGNDNNPGTLSEPFATLERAQKAMRNSSIKTTYIRKGTYRPPKGIGCIDGGGASIYLTSSDNDETWSFYPPDGYNSAIIDGQSTVGNSGGSGGNGTGCAFSGSKVSNITIVGLQFTSYLYSAFLVNTGSDLKFTSNVVHNVTAAAWGAGAVATNCAPGTKVTNNYLYDLAYAGLELQATASCPDGISNILASGNVIENSCTWPAVYEFGNDQNGGDCGAIYLLGPSSSTNIQVDSNYIRDVNKASKGAADYGANGQHGCCAIGVYLDSGTHNVTIKGNIIAGMVSACVQLNDPAYDEITGNVCDLASDSDYQSVVIYGRGKDSPTSMPGNSFKNNIVISASHGTGYGYYGATRTPTPMTIADNIYYNYVGSSIKHTGNQYVGSDTDPVYENPRLSGWTYNLPSGSPVFDSPVSFRGFMRAWGPPGFQVPQTGTPPSCPH
jgi:Right handed beta helix region